MSNAAIVNDANFQSEVLESALPVLVDFWAPWCGPCRALAPTIDEIAGECADKLKVLKLNVDEAPGAAENYQVMSIPTLLLFKGGLVIERIVGAQPKDRLLALIRPHLG
ncbi:MAG: thioredoxin [Spirochaetota bacterium]|jgi:thioredoxin 1|nr:thioredoxin [Spirochaetota bacterium]